MMFLGTQLQRLALLDNMTQFPHDQFAKNLLEVLLSVFGEVKTSLKIVSQVRELDVYFVRDLEC
jgi:hypothetical protein